MFDLILNRLRGKRILILGFGREGRSTLGFLRKYLPDADVAVADKNPMEGVAHSGEGYLQSVYDYDIVIKTPGISLKDFDPRGVEITSQTDLFLICSMTSKQGIPMLPVRIASWPEDFSK